MTVTIDATNMVLIDACDAITGWTSSMGGLQTTTILTRENGISLEDQASQETFDVYHTITAEDYTGRTIFGWMRSGGPDTTANDGFSIYLGDGTNNIAYTTGGSDEYGFFLIGWSLFRLNVDDRPTTQIITLNGSDGSLDETNITRIGYGGNFPAKAAGNSNNVAWDVLRYCSNTNPALLVEGGTTGARGTFQEIATEDDNTANAWGIVRLLVQGSKTFEANFGLQIGSLDSTAYFEDSDFQLIINGSIPDAEAAIAAGSMDIDCVGHSASTNVVNFDNFFVQSVGTVSNWTMSADLDSAEWTNGQFVDCGTLTFPVQDAAAKFLADVIFTNCGAVTASSLDMDRITFNGTTDANGALIVDEDQDTTKRTQSVLVFNSDGTGHAVNVNPVGAGPFEYDFDNWTFTGYGADATTDAEVFINPNTLSADITINILNGGDTPTIREVASYTGTLSIVNAQSIRVEGLTEGAACKCLANETLGTLTTGDTIFEILADANGVAELTTFNYEAAFGAGIDVIIRTGQQGLPNAAQQSDNGTFTDYTLEGNSSTASDMILFPATPVVNEDSFYFGHAEQFTRLKIELNTVGAGGFGITWEYWNGAWVSLSIISDGTSDFTATGEQIVSWTLPGDWATSTEDGLGPYYYVRARYTSGTMSTVPLGRKVQLDVTRYITSQLNRTVTSTGLTTTANHVEDTIAKFTSTD